MKNISIILLLSIVSAAGARGQHLVLSVMTEQTVAGFQYGSRLMFQSSGQWCFGGFYQSSRVESVEGGKYRDVFYGLVIQAPLMRSDKINFYASTRLGFVNKLFLTLVPGFETELKLSKRIGVSVGMSVRMRYPATSAGLYIKI